MTTDNHDHLLDLALERLQAGELVSGILADHQEQAVELEGLLSTAALLENLKPVQVPSSREKAADRDAYLALVSEFQGQAVSPNPIARLNKLMNDRIWGPVAAFGPQWENRKMSMVFVKVAILAMIVFGSVGGTLGAAAQSLPNSAVYPLKMAIEKAQLALTGDPAGQAELQLSFAEERAQEMVQLATRGEVPGEGLLTQAQTHLREAYQLMAQTGDTQMEGLLIQARDMTRTQERDFEQAWDGVQDQIRERLHQGSALMQSWQLEAEAGLEAPQQFRQRFGLGGPCGDGDCQLPGGGGDREQNRQRNQSADPACEGINCQPALGDGKQEQNQNQFGAGEGGNGPGHQSPQGNQNQEQTQNQFGPSDDCSGQACQPGDGNQNQEQNQNQFGAGNDCGGQECDQPYGDQNQEQNQNQNGPGTACQADDCEPAGDNNQEQNQEQEQNQSQGDTQNQNQESNGSGSGGQGPADNGGSGNQGESGGSDDSGSAGSGGDGSGNSSDSGGSDVSGDSGDSGGSGGTGETGGSGSSGGSGGAGGSGGGGGAGG